MTFRRTDNPARGVLVLDAPHRVLPRPASWRGNAPVSPKHATVVMLESTKSSRAVTTLVLLAASTRAGIVAPDLLRGDGLPRNRAPGRCSLYTLGCRFRLCQLDVIDVSNSVPFHRVDGVSEHFEPLPLILREGVALAHSTKPDAGTEVVHLGEMLPPLVVDDGEHHLLAPDRQGAPRRQRSR